MKQTQMVVNALTIDVEDYYQVEAFAAVIPAQDWGCWEARIEQSTHRLLELLARFHTRGTFFILGWLAERHPALIREIVAAGHELACHGYGHQLIRTQSQAEFRQDVRRAKAVLEDISGREIEGYRAPTYSITTETLWALNVLVEEGFRYDSSIFPIHHDRYGLPGAKRFPHVITCPAGELIEFPPSTARLAGQNLPMVGGGYFRFLPYRWFHWGLKHINARERQPAIFMVHSWEVDPQQPVIPGSRLNILRHRFNLHLTEPRLERLLTDFRFSSVREVLRLAERKAVIHEPHLIAGEPVYLHE